MMSCFFLVERMLIMALRVAVFGVQFAAIERFV